MGTFLGLLYGRQITFKPKPLPDHVNLNGKMALVTGANGGLSLEACKELVAHGLSRVILGVRSVAKGETAKNEIVALRTDINVQIWELDQEDFESIEQFADRAATIEHTRSKTGHEMNDQINHLGTSLLSLLLLGPLRRTSVTANSSTRLTIVTSETHFWAKFKEINAANTLKEMDDGRTFGKGMNHYNTTNTRAGVNVIINGVNPGFCQSSLHRSDPSGSSFFNLIGWFVAQGAHCLTDAATQHIEDGHCAYLSEQIIKRPSAFVMSERGRKAQTEIWNETIQLLSQEAPSIDLLNSLYSSES
ncbi:NAD(P)-binding protein [Jackrogersella minutella]|nr:NAD(P)-binding protein [Jackrogersella minutella]